ncbi:YHS domain-containing (seleno)protein [Endozoicomonas arenosclerae]|uniref:YHS domain-containing (seleno)protein n=1 Tax=Endozoicomonas arenosclerae TaxID=1633495 RepID=UPI000780EAC2|nr:YHS domain-containing (seleno)protein [Endozoicomonas arenosclerae]
MIRTHHRESYWLFAIAVFAIALLFSNNAFAAKNIYTGWFSNKAVSGYDTVAYFTEGKAVKGNARFKYKYLEVEWYFSSEKNLEMFKKDPDKYRPQYGGYCAWAIAEKKQRAPGDPNYWKIVDKKLYLNYDADIQSRWIKDIPGFIKLGDKNWPKMMAN